MPSDTIEDTYRTCRSAASVRSASQAWAAPITSASSADPSEYTALLTITELNVRLEKIAAKCPNVKTPNAPLGSSSCRLE